MASNSLKRFRLEYHDFNEIGGITVYRLSVKAYTFGEAKQKLLQKCSGSPWDVKEVFQEIA